MLDYSMVIASQSEDPLRPNRSGLNRKILAQPKIDLRLTLQYFRSDGLHSIGTLST
jgi:hypothetical protein